MLQLGPFFGLFFGTIVKTFTPIALDYVKTTEDLEGQWRTNRSKMFQILPIIRSLSFWTLLVNWIINHMVNYPKSGTFSPMFDIFLGVSLFGPRPGQGVWCESAQLQRARSSSSVVSRENDISGNC